MRYSLVSRFRGTFIGAMVGEFLAFKDETSSQLLKQNLIAIDYICKNLILPGKFQVEDKFARQQPLLRNINANEQYLLNTISATLPIALFFHENIIKLRQSLLGVVQKLYDDPVVSDIALAVGYTIAQSLTEKLSPKTLIPEVVTFLGNTATDIPQQLLKVNDLLNQGAGLQRVIDSLGKKEAPENQIAIAFYCFLTTIEDFRLSILLSHNTSQRLPNHNQQDLVICGITGALSGAYNSTLGIPLAWQVEISRSSITNLAQNHFSQMVELADQLLAVWSGVYDLEKQQSQPSDDKNSTFEQLFPTRRQKNPGLCVYAAPRVIQVR